MQVQVSESTTEREEDIRAVLTLWSFSLPKATPAMNSVMKDPLRVVSDTPQVVAEEVQLSPQVLQAAPHSAQPAAVAKIAISQPEGASTVVVKVSNELRN